MEYVSAKEMASNWKITKARVITLAKSGRIPGATLCGNQWLIPKDSVKPGDGRRKNTSPSDYKFHFPLFLYSQFTDATFLESLSAEEKELLECQLLFAKCDFSQCNIRLKKLLSHTKNIYVRIGTLYFLCNVSAITNKTAAFKTYFEMYKIIFEEDFPHKEDVKTMILDIESLYLGNDYFVKNFHPRNDYTYSLDTIPFLDVQATYSTMLSKRHSSNINNDYTIALNCLSYEQRNYPLVAQTIHLYYSFDNIWKEEPDYSHIKRAIELGIQYNSYFILASVYPYLKDLFSHVLKEFDSSVAEKISTVSLFIQKNIVNFIGSDVSNVKKLIDLSDNDIQLLNYCVMGYTNKVVSEITGIPEYTVRRRYEKLFQRFEVTKKKSLATEFKNFISGGYK